MNRNNLFFSLVIVALLAMAVLTIRAGLATSAIVSSTAAVSNGSVQPPELANRSQAPDPAGYFGQIHAAVPVAIHNAAQPPEMYSTAQSPDLAGYWNTVSRSYSSK